MALLSLGLVALTGCSSKSIEVNKDTTVIFDEKRDGNIKEAGGKSGGGGTGSGPMSGKKMPMPK